jgi:hypothetical protein
MTENDTVRVKKRHFVKGNVGVIMDEIKFVPEGSFGAEQWHRLLLSL